jgi:hypothetical protein
VVAEFPKVSSKPPRGNREYQRGCMMTPLATEGSSSLLCRVSMCLCKRKAWCNQKAEEDSSAGYIAVDFDEAS